MTAEFKIGRLRFTWAGEWETGTFYNRDAVSQFNGKTYVCVIPHTSGVFYDDLNFSTPEGGLTPYWNLMIDGRSWKQDWLPSTAYSLGNIVRFAGVVYICTEPHTSGLRQLDLTKWSTYAQFSNWNSAWQVNTVYGLGDIVKYGGIVYNCILGHISSASAALGLEADQSKWEIVNSGIEYKNNWASATRYKLNDLVKNGADIYRCNTYHTSTSTFDLVNWTLWLPGQEYVNAWSNTVVYQPGDIVIYGGYSYICKILNNVDAIPSTETAEWELVTQGYRIRNAWTSSNQYRVGDVVTRGGNLYSAIADSASQDPAGFAISTTATSIVGTTLTVDSTVGIVKGMIVVGLGFTQGQSVVKVEDETTVIISEGITDELAPDTPLEFVGVNYVYWTLVVPSISWKNFWTDSTPYVVNELVIWQNATYRCIKNHNSSSFFRPDNDIDNQFWVVYAIHAKENAGNTAGDIVAFGETGTVAVPILSESADEGDTEDYLLRVFDVQPNWKKMFQLPDVFYVATTGVDADTHGHSIDMPWRSIGYACAQVEQGFYFQNANTLLVSNKNFLVEEMYEWMLYQKENNIAPFTSSSIFDEYSTKRDAQLVIDALSYDITRASNGRIVTAARRYFADNSTTSFFNEETDAAQPYIVASLERLLVLIGYILQNNAPDVNYQELKITWDSTNSYSEDDIVFYQDEYYISLSDTNVNHLPTEVDGIFWELLTVDPNVTVKQFINESLPLESFAYFEISSLLEILITAIDLANNKSLPLISQGATATINIKTGTYSEQLPIVVSDNTSLTGDELRGVTVQPLVNIFTTVYRSYESLNVFDVATTERMAVNMPIQFSTPASSILAGLEVTRSDITLGQTYYIATINEVNNQISIKATINGSVLPLINSATNLELYAGDCLNDMFYMRDTTNLKNMTLTGLAGFLSPANSFGTRRPTGGSYVSLDPGSGPNDTKGWIIRRSPFIQNITNFGVGCTGMKIDGTLHNGGNRSIVCNDFTQIISDGIGVWCTGTRSLTECVSVFGYYNYAGYMAEDGGRIRATNGNSSYGTFGVIAEGFDDNESPITGNIDNQSSQVQADVVNAFGANAELLSMQYGNAGANYYEETTNLLKYSNRFDQPSFWNTDGNVLIQQNTTSPTGETDGWSLTGTTSGTDSGYLYQFVSILPAGGIYTNTQTVNVTGAGVGATFDITVTGTSYLAVVNDGGEFYVSGSQLRIPGSVFGGEDGANDCFLTVTSLAGSAILDVSVSGTVPTNSNLNYTMSMYVKEGTASSVEMAAIFSGTTTVSTYINFNFATNIFTTTTANGGAVPISYNKLELENGWWRIWATVYDSTGLNTSAQFRIYPRGRNGLAGFTRIFGTQLQVSATPTFYLETDNDQHNAYANYKVSGAGINAKLVGNEIRTNSVFQVRITDTGVIGGRGYLISSNNAQAGNTSSIVLSGSDTNLASNYVGMRVFLNSGTGAGQYGYISAFDDSITKTAQVLKESFNPLAVISTNNLSGIITLGAGNTTDTLFIDQPVQFIPTYYSTNITTTSVDFVQISATTGGSVNTFTTTSTDKLSVNMPVQFGGALYGGVTANFTYFIKEIFEDNTFSVSSEPFGTALLLNSSSGAMVMSFPGYNSQIVGSTTNMTINMPIQFTGSSVGGIAVGTTYYVNDVISFTRFTISSVLVTITPTATAASTNLITATTSQLVILNPIEFSGETFGGINPGVKYYIAKINASTFTVTETLIERTATATTTLSNLITVNSTTGFTANSPIIFTGNTFGGIVNEAIYYVLAVNDGTTFTISTSPGGSAVNLSTAVGEIAVKTPDTTLVLSNGSGSMTGTTTNAKTTLSLGYGAMTGTYSTNLFGNVEAGTTYYVISKDSNTTFKVSETIAGSAVTLKTDTGAMNIAAVGWDHINPGTEIQSSLDNSTVYYIEPRVTFTLPAFDQVVDTTNTLASGTQWQSIAYGNGMFIGIPSGNAIGGMSTDGLNWTALPLLQPGDWTDIAYGNNSWVIISSGGFVGGSNSVVLYSINNGEGWKTSSLPTQTSWNNVAYGNGRFVAIATNDTDSAYSTNYGGAWLAGTGLARRSWKGLTYGLDKFVAVSSGTVYENVASQVVAAIGSPTGARFDVVSTSGGAYNVTRVATGSGYAPDDTIKILGTAVGGTTPTNDVFITVTSAGMGGTLGGFTVTSGTASALVSTTAAYTMDGTSWISTTLPSSTAWSDIAFGNGLFVAVSSASHKPAYSRDGITWSQSDYTIGGVSKVAYGQGVFVAVSGVAGIAYTSEDGYNWLSQVVEDAGYTAMTYGYTGVDKEGTFVTMAGTDSCSTISAGCRTKGRALLTSGTISAIALSEPGSGYVEIAPAVTIRDPNVTISASTSVRTGNGTLGNPTFVNRGQDYNTNSTQVVITGGGYADTFQTGLTIIVKNLSALPAPGDNLLFTGYSKVYKVTSATPVFGSVAPNIQANVQLSPDLSVEFSPPHNNAFIIRTKYSQCRLTGHDFLNVGFGNAIASNYPGLPADTVLAPQDQAVEVNFGRVFYTSTDQDGNFKVGDLFGVEQATGIVTLSATQFGLEGLETLSLGGIAVGGSSVVIRQFSTDSTFIANSNSIIPTQRAVKAYLTSRLSQGGSNTFTGQLIAGTVLVGGADKISSTIPEGSIGAVVNMPTKVTIDGQFGGWDGDGMAYSYFANTWVRPGAL